MDSAPSVVVQTNQSSVLSQLVQACPFFLFILLLVYRYTPNLKDNQDMKNTIFAFAIISLFVILSGVVNMSAEIMKVTKTGIMKLSPWWYLTTIYIAFMLFFVCIVITGFSNNGENLEGWILDFINIGVWIYLAGMLFIPYQFGLRFTITEVRDIANKLSQGITRTTRYIDQSLKKVPQRTSYQSL